MPRVSRFQGFLLASALVVGAVVLFSGVVVCRFFERQALVHDEESTAKAVQTQARQHLRPTDFEASFAPVGRPVFRSFLQELPGVFSINVFDGSGQVLWSDESGLVGTTFPNNSFLAQALQGQVATVLSPPMTLVPRDEPGRPYIAKIYVPITLPGDAALVGVIEASKDVSPVVREMNRTRRLIWGVLGAASLFLYLAVAFIAWRARVKERRAIDSLEARNRELTHLHQALSKAQTQLVEKERLAAAGQVVVGLHHAILNPLTGILGALQLLKQEGMPPPEQRRVIVEAEAEIREVERLIRRLPELKRAAETPYVGTTTMLDLDDQFTEGKKAGV